jgi:NAD-specific glutamate dehydrogenase
MLARHQKAGGEGIDYAGFVRSSDLSRFRDIVEELKAEESVGLAALSVAGRELAAVADGMVEKPGSRDLR